MTMPLSSAVLLLFGLLAVATSCTDSSAAHARAPVEPPVDAVPVRLASVERGPLTRTLRCAGVLQLKNQMALSFKTGGLVQRVNGEVGQRVNKGHPLAVVDRTESEAALQTAQQNFDKLSRDLLRARQLLASGVGAAVPVQDLENATAVAHAALLNAKYNLQHTAVLAPEAGRIDRREVEVGEFATPGRVAFHMSGDSRGLVVRAPLLARDVATLALDTPARVRLDALPERVFAAQVSEIATVATAGVGTFEVEFRIGDLEPAWRRSGLTAKVEIDRLEHPAAVVPVLSLVDGEQKRAFVYQVDAQKRAHRTPVQIGFLQGDRAALAEAVGLGSVVVGSGAAQLSDGALVRVLP